MNGTAPSLEGPESRAMESKPSHVPRYQTNGKRTSVRQSVGSIFGVNSITVDTNTSEDDEADETDCSAMGEGTSVRSAATLRRNLSADTYMTSTSTFECDSDGAQMPRHVLRWKRFVVL